MEVYRCILTLACLHVDVNFNFPFQKVGLGLSTPLPNCQPTNRSWCNWSRLTPAPKLLRVCHAPLAMEIPRPQQHNGHDALECASHQEAITAFRPRVSQTLDLFESVSFPPVPVHSLWHGLTLTDSLVGNWELDALDLPPNAGRTQSLSHDNEIAWLKITVFIRAAVFSWFVSQSSDTNECNSAGSSFVN